MGLSDLNFLLPVWVLYQSSMDLFPNATAIITGACLGAGGDMISQLVCERKTSVPYLPARTLRFSILGAVLTPPATLWFIFLEENVKFSSELLTAIVRVFFDQTLSSLFFNSVSLIFLRAMEMLPFTVIMAKWWQDLGPIYLNSLKVWPLISFGNFYLIPLKYRLLINMIASLFWNTYVSFRAHILHKNKSVTSSI